MNILAIDTAAGLCAACVLDTGTGEERGRAVLDLGKGHAEHLMGVIGEALAQAGIGYADIGMIAVSVGPGSFTGVRVGVSVARGLALALKVPAVGVATLEAIAAEAGEAFPRRRVLTAIDAGRGQIYATIHAPDGSEMLAPAVMPAAEAAELAATGGPVLAGSAAMETAALATGHFEFGPTGATADIATYAKIALRRGLPGLPPRPLYLRQADAKPQEGFALPRRSAT